MISLRHRPDTTRRCARPAGVVLTLALFIVSLLTAVGSMTVTVHAQDRSVVWEEIDVVVELREDGSFHVTERDRIEFIGGPFRSGFAEIPLGRVEEIENVTVGEVTGDAVQPYRYVSPRDFSPRQPNTYTFQTDQSDLLVEWSFQPTISTTKAFEIAFDVEGGLRTYPEADPPYQQMDWIAVDPEVTEIGPVNEARLTFVLPRPVDPARTEILFPGDSVPQDHTEDGQTWVFEARDLREGDFLEAGLRFDPIVAAPIPGWQEAVDRQERQEAERAAQGGQLNLLFLGLGGLIAIGGSVAALAAWWTSGRDPEVGPVAEFIPDPPDSLPPGVIGALLDEEVDQRDIVATLVDLGHRGVLRIDRTEGEGLFGRGGDFTLTMLDQVAAVAPFERELLTALFGSDLENAEQAELSNVKGRFAAAQPEIKRRLYDELVQRGYFVAPPQQTRGRWKSIGIFVLIVAIVGGCIAVGAVADIAPAVLIPAGALLALGLIVVVISRFMPQKTPAGAEAAAKWRAFKNYLASIERYEKLDEAEAIFDRFLPYAIAFGLERDWVDKFSRVPTASPTWYGDDGAPHPGPVGRFPYPRPWYGPYGGGTVIIPGGGGAPGGPASGGGRGDFGDSGIPAGDGGAWGFPDFQDFSDQAGRSLQSSSGSLFDLFNSAGDAFSGGGWGGGGGGGWRGGSGFGGFGGGGGGFGGGGFGGGGGGGGRGFG